MKVPCLYFCFIWRMEMLNTEQCPSPVLHAPFAVQEEEIICVICRCLRKKSFDGAEAWVALVAEKSDTKLLCKYEPNRILVVHNGDEDSRQRAIAKAEELRASYHGLIWWEPPLFETDEPSRGCMLWTTGNPGRPYCM